MIIPHPALLTGRVRKQVGSHGVIRGIRNVLGIGLICGSFSMLGAQDAPRAGRFRVPEVNEDGVLTSMLTGESARMVPGRPLEIEKLAIYFYEADGETVRMRVSSPTCLYDDRRGIATSEDEVRIEGTQFTIDGKRFAYHANDERMEIFEDVVVILRNVGGAGYVRPAPAATDAPDPEPAAETAGADAPETDEPPETTDTP